MKNINLKIKRGEKVAIIGESGGGKSTIVKLLLGFYKPNKGDIKIFGVPLREWNLERLREKFSVANQDVYLFPESFKENIRYGKYDAKDDEIIIFAKKALAFDFITEEHGGFDTKVGERGVNLSGGQRQRIAIARALLKNSPILLLDEATSSLDPESEELVNNALQRLMEGKTTLVIAHRLSTIQNADVIYVVDDGRIVEKGTHEELLSLNGKYKTLYEVQFK
ncbi:MAG: hypothetical protein CBR30_02010 [Dictyoglomus sp. NZ13-RE01]|nr:MAG: hypothetical protein CBR30_02010 [Dictyoglomus sp. NZ13-RE01]